MEIKVRNESSAVHRASQIIRSEATLDADYIGSMALSGCFTVASLGPALPASPSAAERPEAEADIRCRAVDCLSADSQLSI